MGRCAGLPGACRRCRRSKERSGAAGIELAGGELLRKGAAKFVVPGSSLQARTSKEEEGNGAQLRGYSPELARSGAAGIADSLQG